MPLRLKRDKMKQSAVKGLTLKKKTEIWKKLERLTAWHIPTLSIFHCQYIKLYTVNLLYKQLLGAETTIAYIRAIADL